MDYIGELIFHGDRHVRRRLSIWMPAVDSRTSRNPVSWGLNATDHGPRTMSEGKTVRDRLGVCRAAKSAAAHSASVLKSPRSSDLEHCPSLRFHLGDYGRFARHVR